MTTGCIIPGNESLKIISTIRKETALTTLDYSFTIINIREIDASRLLQENVPEVIILALLTGSGRKKDVLESILSILLVEKFLLSEAEKSSIAEKINKIDDVERLEELMISVIRLQSLEEFKKQLE